MKFFLDTANLNEIREAAAFGFADGVTTNPSLIAKESGVDFKQHIADARATGRLWMIISRRGAYSKVETRLEPYTKEQIERIVTAHLSQTHTSTAGAQ